MNCSICGSPAKSIPLCRKHYLQKYNKENRERLREQARLREQSPKAKTRKAKWRARTRSQMLLYQANYRATQKEKIRAASIAYYEKNKTRIIAAARTYYKANPESVKAYRTNRKARIRGALGKHTGKQIRELFIKQRGLCAICEYPMEKFHKDHIVPLSKGGSNDIGNIQLTHPTCNLKKHTKSQEEFMRELGNLL